MLKVHICEDSKTQRAEIKKKIENIILMENLNMKVECVCDDPDVLLDNIKDNKEVGIYFLDIDLGARINGIVLANEIRKVDPRGFVIFVTTHSEMSFLNFDYKIEALDFIAKDRVDQLDERIRSCLLLANERFSSANNRIQGNFTFKYNEKMYTIDYDDIIYFETSSIKHKIILHCINREMEFPGNMVDIQGMLDDRFYRCHRSFILNKDKIDHIDFVERVAYMQNGDQCEVSLRLMKGLKIEKRD